MSDTVLSVAYNSQLTVKTGVTPLGESQITITNVGMNTVVNASPTTTPAVSIRGRVKAVMSGGALANAIDLTAIPQEQGADADGTGKKVQFIKFINPGANPITVAKGASNGSDALGSDFSITIPAGGEVLVKCNGGNNIGSSNKTFDISGTLAQYLLAEICVG